MNIDQIERNLITLSQNINRDEFIFDLLLAYGVPKATITLLKKGKHNFSTRNGRIILKRKVFFQEEIDTDIHESIDKLQKDILTSRYSPRFLVVTDYITLLAADLKTGEHLDIPIKNISKHFDFFLPWAGIEKHRQGNENPADRKAAEKMAKLYDEIFVENTIKEPQRLHDLNVFLSRLLFCFFAEDTNIFESKLFTNSIASHTQEDGSDFGDYLDKLFEVLNSSKRTDFPQYLQRFPYVNGGLFATKHWIPSFTARSRKIIIECGKLNWSQINPDIFGSMMQAVARQQFNDSNNTEHYTSVPNIMKVIEPLFLYDLKKEFEESKSSKTKLQLLLNRISNIKFFDPACGSGNFLIITYKELRRLEMNIIKELGVFSFSSITLSQFYGIEIDDFAHEIAKLSLHLAEHLMNIEFKNEFSDVSPTLPLKTNGNIFCGNATKMKWEEVCVKDEDDEIYILGNPPYCGSRYQSKEQKADMKEVFTNDYKSLDYISCWFHLGAKYIRGINSKLAFVSTNSISQGEQVALLWPSILGNQLEIFFANQSFKWTNNAKKNAAVIVVIIGLQNISKGMKTIYKGNIYSRVKFINPYLTESSLTYIKRRSTPLNIDFPKIVYGNLLNDGGNLVLSEDEKNNLLENYPNSSKFIRRYIGAKEFIHGEERFCLYISDDQLSEAELMPPIKERLERIKKLRSDSSEVSTRKMPDFPHRYYFSSHKETNSIIIPRTSSEGREYIPIGFLDSQTIISDAAQAIYGAEPWIFGIISSHIHMTWVRAVAGRLKTDYRYSSALCYNTFPIPHLMQSKKDEITRHVYNILEEREKYSEKTIAQMYDPENMPKGLKEAHRGLDLAVEICYRSKSFVSEEDRLEHLFKLYEKMIIENI